MNLLFCSLLASHSLSRHHPSLMQLTHIARSSLAAGVKQYYSFSFFSLIHSHMHTDTLTESTGKGVRASLVLLQGWSDCKQSKERRRKVCEMVTCSIIWQSW